MRPSLMTAAVLAFAACGTAHLTAFGDGGVTKRGDLAATVGHCARYDVEDHGKYVEDHFEYCGDLTRPDTYVHRRYKAAGDLVLSTVIHEVAHKVTTRSTNATITEISPNTVDGEPVEAVKATYADLSGKLEVAYIAMATKDGHAFVCQVDLRHAYGGGDEYAPRDEALDKCTDALSDMLRVIRR